MTDGPPAISLVIPVYNEEARIPRYAREILGFATAYPEPVEVIFVDDGSRDGSVRLLEAAISGVARARVIPRPVNEGKGSAIAAGVAAAAGDLVVFTDLDLSVPLDLLPRVVSALRAGGDVAIGSRRIPGADIRVHQPWYREFMGDVFRRLTRAILLPGVSDFTCGFKGFRGEVAKELFGALTIPRWGFDVEILYLARRRGRRIVEVPVPWTNSEQTKVRLGRDVVGSLREILAIRLAAWRGDYDHPAEG